MFYSMLYNVPNRYGTWTDNRGSNTSCIAITYTPLNTIIFTWYFDQMS